MSGRFSLRRCSLVVALVACLPTSPAQSPTVASAGTPAQYGQTCSVCHGEGGEGTDRGPALVGSRRLRGQSEAEIAAVIKNGRANMPPFSSLPDQQIQALAHFVHSSNANVFDLHPAGDTAAGSRVFWGSGHCSNCHTAQGHGGAGGPDLSNIAHLATLSDLTLDLRHLPQRAKTGYQLVDVKLRNGTMLHGFARNWGSHSLDLQTLDGQLHLLGDQQYTQVSPSPDPPGPAFNGSPDEQRDLIAYLSTLGGVGVGPNLAAQETIAPAAFDAILHPKSGEWATYSGSLNGNRFSPLTEINTQNVAALRPVWVHPLLHDGLETTPLVVDGVMYVTGPNQVFALDPRTGVEIWSFTRAHSAATTVSDDAARGNQRGVAVLGDRLFYITDNAHLICLQRLTGALLWDVSMPDETGQYGGTSAPLVVGDLVIAGVSGGDQGIRGFLAAYKASTGEQAWRFWTVPKAGEPASETWEGDPNPQGGSTWTTGSYDPETGVLYWGTGNPFPDTNGDHRGGDNLYTESDVALDAKTGKLLWHFQFTPHDVHDWDANQPVVLVDAKFQGIDRKLLLHANRNGYFYVLDRTTGKLLQASPMVKHLTWASGVGSDGRPVLTAANETTAGGMKTCPSVRGATNWYASAFNPATQLYYVITLEDCSIFRKTDDSHGGFRSVNDPADPPIKVLRAFALDGGKIVWEVPLIGQDVERNFSGVLATAGGLVFLGETSGGFAAVDATNGDYLWHSEVSQLMKAAPMTYTIDGQQYIAIAAGPNIISYALPEK